jgi:hypothetical protein
MKQNLTNESNQSILSSRWISGGETGRVHYTVTCGTRSPCHFATSPSARASFQPFLLDICYEMRGRKTSPPNSIAGCGCEWRSRGISPFPLSTLMFRPHPSSPRLIREKGNEEENKSRKGRPVASLFRVLLYSLCNCIAYCIAYSRSRTSTLQALWGSSATHSLHPGRFQLSLAFCIIRPLSHTHDDNNKTPPPPIRFRCHITNFILCTSSHDLLDRTEDSLSNATLVVPVPARALIEWVLRPRPTTCEPHGWLSLRHFSSLRPFWPIYLYDPQTHNMA